MKKKIIIIVILLITTIALIVYYSFIRKVENNINEIPDEYFTIDVQHIQDSTKLFDNSNFLFKTLCQSTEEIYFKLKKYVYDNIDYYSFDFAFRNTQDYEILLQPQFSDWFIVKGRLISRKDINKAALILWTNQYNIYYDNESNQYSYTTGFGDRRYFPWEVGKLTYIVYSNLDSNFIRKLYPDFNGKIYTIKLDSIIVDWSKYDPLDNYMLSRNFVQFVNLRIK